MSYDEMELDMIGDQRTAMFVIISDTDDTFNFVVAIMYTQLFNLLCDKADDEHGGRLPYHVRLLLDEFSNIGQIPKIRQIDCYDPKQGNFRFYHSAVTISAENHL